MSVPYNPENVYYVNGRNPPVLAIPCPWWPDMVQVVPVSLPWASTRIVRRDKLTRELTEPIARKLAGLPPISARPKC